MYNFIWNNEAVLKNPSFPARRRDLSLLRASPTWKRRRTTFLSLHKPSLVIAHLNWVFIEFLCVSSAIFRKKTMMKFIPPLLSLLLACSSQAQAEALNFPEFDYESDCQKWRGPELLRALRNDGG